MFSKKKRISAIRSSRKRIGLTGGMGCGKSRVLRYLGEFGCETLETDRIGRDLLEGDADVRRELLEEFGSGILDSEGRIDRRALGTTVFNDSNKLACLESVLHPRIRSIWIQALADARGWIVVEIPLLFEKNLESEFDLTVCVAASRQIQMERLKSRGYSQEHCEQRLRQQLPIELKADKADVVIWNDGSLEVLREQVRHLTQSLDTES